MFLRYSSLIRQFRKISLILVILFSQTIYVLGQGKTRITGIVNDMESKAVPFVTIEVVDSESNETLTKYATDQYGRFSILVSKTDAVFIKIEALGYKNYTTDVFQVASRGTFTLNTIVLEKEEIVLDEINVIVKMPQVAQKADRTVVNLEGNVLASGSNILEVMSRLPGVFVDKDGNIIYNSKTDILVTINGRQTYMGPGDLATYLKSQPSENLKSIELFSNPPSNFDAAGNGGVINLNLKAIKAEGLNGSVSAGTKYNESWGYTSSTSLNYMSGKWQTKLGFSRNSYFTNVDLDINKRFTIPGISQPTTMDQTINWDVRLKTFLMDMTVDYSISEGHRVEISYQYSNDNRNDLRNAFTRTFSVKEGDNEVSTIVKDQIPGNRHSFDLFYVADLDTLGSDVSADFSYVRSDRGFNSKFNSTSYNVLQQLFTDNPVEYEVLAGQIDLSKVYSGGKVFKVGGKYSRVRSDNNLIMQMLQGDIWEVVRDNSYRFLYSENIVASYINYYAPIGEKVNVNGGIRAEYTNMSGENLATDFQNKRSYFNLFPSVSVEHKISGTYRMAITLNRRITRPNFKLLNPFVRYVDPYTVHTGFPQIKPSYANSFEINSILKDKYQLALMYSKVTDVFGVVLTQNDSSLITTYQTRNLENQTDFGIRGNLPISFIKWWKSDNSAQLSRISFKSMIDNEPLDLSLTTYSIQSQHNLSLFSGIKFQVIGSLFGPRQYSFFRQDTQFNLDAGLQKSFLENKLTLSINGTDLLKSQYFKGETRFFNVNSMEKEYDSNRSLMITLKYTFSRGKDFSIIKPTRNADEANRMN